MRPVVLICGMTQTKGNYHNKILGEVEKCLWDSQEHIQLSYVHPLLAPFIGLGPQISSWAPDAYTTSIFFTN